MISPTPNALLAPAHRRQRHDHRAAESDRQPDDDRRAVGSRCAIRLATAATNSGVAPFSMPVSADDTCCSANGNMLSGNASHSTPSAAVPAQSARATGRRADGNRDSVRKPIAMRVNVTPFGATASRPSAMNRKDAPQMTPGTTNRAHSTSELLTLFTMAVQMFRTSE